MDVSNIPQSMMNDIRQLFESTPEIRILRAQEQLFRRNGDFKSALSVAKQIEALFPFMLQAYIDKAEKEASAFDTETADISLEDKEDMMDKLLVVFMACDIIDTAIRDVDDVMHKTESDLHITSFDDIRQLSDMARQKLRYLQDVGDYMEDLIFAEKVDNMYEMLLSKAKAVRRKRKEDKNWGKNMEHYKA